MLLWRKVERKKWLNTGHSWVPEGEFHADPLGDLQTSGGDLSVWCLDEGLGEVHVAAAVAALSMKLPDLSYYVISEDALTGCGFELKRCNGNSADPQMNRSCHRDIVHLTEKGLLDLAALFREKGELRICAQPTILVALSEGIRSGRIDRAQVKPPWFARMAEEGLLPG